MKTFKSTYDVEQLRNDPVHASIHSTLKELFAMYTDPPYQFQHVDRVPEP